MFLVEDGVGVGGVSCSIDMGGENEWMLTGEDGASDKTSTEEVGESWWSKTAGDADGFWNRCLLGVRRKRFLGLSTPSESEVWPRQALYFFNVRGLTIRRPCIDDQRLLGLGSKQCSCWRFSSWSSCSRRHCSVKMGSMCET